MVQLVARCAHSEPTSRPTFRALLSLIEAEAAAAAATTAAAQDDAGQFAPPPPVRAAASAAAAADGGGGLRAEAGAEGRGRGAGRQGGDVFAPTPMKPAGRGGTPW
eukprot:COSAG06_NODE_1923_length_8061_cov_15.756091_6_plen_106_part_00